MGRPSDNMQPSGKRRPGEQLTKDNYDESDDEGQAGDPGTWGKADAATMAKRKVIRVRRGAAPAAAAAEDQPAAADNSNNPFAGVSLAAPAPAAANPFAGVSLTAVAAQPPAAQKADDAAPAEAAAASAADAPKQAEAAPAAQQEPAADAKEAAAAPDAAAPAASPADKPQADQAKQQQQPSKADDADAAKPDDKAATAAAAGGSTGGFGGFAAATAGTGSGFGGFGGLASGGFGGFGGFAAAAKDGPAGTGGSLFGSYTAPQPTMFGSFGAAGGSSKGKDVEEGQGDGQEEDGGGEDNGQELFGGHVAPVVHLEEVAKQTGEEGEDCAFSAEGKLYEFVDGKDWRERGRGDLRLNVHAATHKARLVMRQKGSQRLLLNARLFPKMTTSKMVGGKGATFAVVNSVPVAAAEGDKGDNKEGAGAEAGGEAAAAAAGAATGMRTYAFKAKSADEIDAFLAAVNTHKDGTAAAAAAQPSNPDAW